MVVSTAFLEEMTARVEPTDCKKTFIIVALLAMKPLNVAQIDGHCSRDKADRGVFLITLIALLVVL